MPLCAIIINAIILLALQVYLEVEKYENYILKLVMNH